MRNLQIIGNVPQVRRESNFGEYAEEAVIIEEQPQVKKENPHFLEANTLEVTMQHLKEDCITPVFAKDNELTIPTLHLLILFMTLQIRFSVVKVLISPIFV